MMNDEVPFAKSQRKLVNENRPELRTMGSYIQTHPLTPTRCFSSFLKDDVLQESTLATSQHQIKCSESGLNCRVVFSEPSLRV